MATFTDTFNGASPDLTWTPIRGSASLQLAVNGDGTASLPGISWQYARATSDTGAAAMYAEAVIAAAFDDAPRRAVVLAGLTSAAETTGYAAVLHATNQTCTILRNVNSSAAPITADPVDVPVTIPATPFTFRIEVDGTTVRALIDGAVVATATDTSPIGGTYGGLGASDGDTVLRYDSFRTGGLADTPPAAPVVDAGVDATITLGDTFTRTATETGDPTSRLWSVLSGPAEQGATLATTAALTWSPTVAGTYVLRYSATNAEGTGTDDVTVTVTDPGGGGGGGTRQNLTENPAQTVDNVPPWYGPTDSPGRVTGLTGMARTTGFSVVAGSSTTARWPVTAGLPYASSIEADPDYTGNLTVGIDFYDTAGWIGGDSTTISVTAGVVQRAGVVVTAPTGAVEAVGIMAHAGGAAVFTAHLAEQSDTIGTYFDGDTPDAVWDDGAPPSTSTLTVEATPPQLVDTYSAEAANAPATLTTATFTPRENEVLVVKAIAGDEDVTIGDPTGGALTWTQRTTRTDTDYTPIRTHTAVVGPNPEPMAVTVEFARAASVERAPTLVVERWAYAQVGTSGAAVGPDGDTDPGASLTTSAANARVTWMVGDWEGVEGAETYRANTTETHSRRITGVINVWAAYTLAEAPGATPIGLDAPTGQRWAIAAVELQPGPAPIGEPSGPDTAAERYGWGAPLAASDEFDVVGVPDRTKWSLYDGDGHNDGDGPNGTRDPERINVIAGTGPDDPPSFLRIEGTADGSTGGMAHLHDRQYGRWETRARWDAFTPGSEGGAYHAVLIVWPQSNEWPEDGEYDWVEIADVEQTSLEAYLHFPHPDGPVEQVHEVAETSPGVPRVFDDFSQWHNYAFEWVEGALKGYVDGDEWFSLDGALTSSNGRRLDSMPAGHLTVQLDNFTGDTGLQPAYMDLAWMRVYSTDGSTEIGTGAGSTGAVLDQAGTGDKAATGDALAEVVDLDARSTGDADRPGDGDAPLEVAATATAGPITRTGAGTAGTTLATAGRGEGVHGASGAATLNVTVDAVGHGAASARTGEGTTALDLDATGTGQGVRATTGATATVLDVATAAGSASRPGTGTTDSVLDTRGDGTAGPRTGAGTAGVTAAAIGSGQPTTTGTGHVDGILDQAGAGTGTRAATGTPAPVTVAAASTPGPVARTGDATTEAGLGEYGGGDAARHGSGTVGLALGGRATGFPGGAGRAHTNLRLATTGTGLPGPRTGTATTGSDLDTAGTGEGVRASTGATGLEVATAGVGRRATTGATTAGTLLEATGDGRTRATVGDGSIGVEVAAHAGGDRATTGTGPTGVAVATAGEGVRATAGTAPVGAALAATGGGPRIATGRGTAGIAVGEHGTGARTTTGAGVEQLATGTTPADEHATRASTGHPGELALDARPDGHRVAVGRGDTGLTLGAASTAGVTVRSGAGRARLLSGATGDGTPGPRHGSGRAPLSLGAPGTGTRRARGHGRTGLALWVRPRYIVPGRASTGHTSRAGLHPSHGSTRTEPHHGR